MMIDQYFEQIRSIVGQHFPAFETELVCVDIQNVYKAFYSEDSPPHVVNVKGDLPNLAPPWPLAWYEHRSIEPGTKQAYGILFGCADPNTDRTLALSLKREFPDVNFARMKWLVRYFFFFEIKTLKECIFAFSGTDALDADGESLLGDVFFYQPSELLLKHPEPDSALVNLYPAMMAISFLHCKNVSVQEGDPKTKIHKKRAKKSKQPFFRFKTLDIQPMKEVLRNEGGLQEHGLKMALHICRGHFKDYRNGRGLFGKVKGLFWWDMHKRGDDSEGIIHKDYRVDV